MKIKELSDFLESIAPLSLQESYDNCGLILGSGETEISKALITLDCTEAIVQEAIEEGCNLIITHHPIIFTGIKKLNGKNYVERTVIKAIQHHIAVYAIHTNLDNVYNGVNAKIAERLGLSQCEILEPRQGNLLKLVTFVPKSHIELVKAAIFEAGAGHIGNYSECSFASSGTGTFKAGLNAKPFVGNKLEQHREEEHRIETIMPYWLKSSILSALMKVHPYEEVAYDMYELKNENKQAGSGLLGVLPEKLTDSGFLALIKDKMELKAIKHTMFEGKYIQKVAVCGGAGSFLLKQAIAAEADAFVSSDFKYHEFFDAENKLLIADIGHYESEKFTKLLLSELILEKFPTFALLLSKLNTNPVNFYI
ncbi:MAG: Nif3-like dinuclear metal center hexameric protein [Bacteroidota bacterium]|nr:Nif3-like dinuclear metal center hexameric protein [Bacteroidota bacterium]